jgi:hypothetical protein
VTPADVVNRLALRAVLENTAAAAREVSARGIGFELAPCRSDGCAMLGSHCQRVNLVNAFHRLMFSDEAAAAYDEFLRRCRVVPYPAAGGVLADRFRFAPADRRAFLAGGMNLVSDGCLFAALTTPGAITHARRVAAAEPSPFWAGFLHALLVSVQSPFEPLLPDGLTLGTVEAMILAGTGADPAARLKPISLRRARDMMAVFRDETAAPPE